MELYLVRHGETIENVEGIVQGQNPGHLSPNGIKQARELGKKLKGHHFDALYSSDLQRCVDTSKQIIKYLPGLKLRLAPQLREVNFGDFQGTKGASINWDEMPGNILNKRPPEGETYLEMAKRSIGFINELYERHPGQSVICVSHGGPIRAIRACVENRSLEQILGAEVENTAVYKIKMSAPLELRHLHGEASGGYSEAFWYL